MDIAKPSITKSFNETVFPEMAKDGFLKLSSKIFAKIVDEQVLQWVSVYAKSDLKREYFIEFGTQLLCVPSNALVMTVGGRFTKLSSGGTYGAKTEVMLAQSIVRALAAYKEEAKPDLSKADTVDKLITEYLNLATSSPAIYKTGHPSFNIACAYALKRKNDITLNYLSQAKDFYLQLDTDWAKEYILKADLLNAAICENYADKILSEWRNYTAISLKLKNV